MARITIYLPDELVDIAQRAGIDTAELCQRAVAAEVGRLDAGPMLAHSARRRADDRQRFQRGMELGIGWARHATPTEIGEIAAWRGQRWRQFKVDPATNSLPAAFCRDNRLDEPSVDQDYWFERDAYTVGMIQGVVAAAHRSPV